MNVVRAPAPAKINLALVVGPLRADGKHEVATVLAPLALHDEIFLSTGHALDVSGFADDTIVAEALRRLSAAAGTEPRWRVRIEKRIPVAAGLGGGSSDAATALRLANATLRAPLPTAVLHALAAGLGADVPFFLHDGPRLGAGDGTELEPLELPSDFCVVLVVPHGQAKGSTADVYRRFDERDGARGYAQRRRELRAVLAAVASAADLAGLPGNDLASSSFADRLRGLGAFRADVSGAGPAVYGLFQDEHEAVAARRTLAAAGATCLTRPAW